MAAAQVPHKKHLTPHLGIKDSKPINQTRKSITCCVVFVGASVPLSPVPLTYGPAPWVQLSTTAAPPEAKKGEEVWVLPEKVTQGNTQTFSLTPRHHKPLGAALSV